ncbi:MAG: RluA family pseudouridine synthase [Nanoarchaeota archaeon]
MTDELIITKEFAGVKPKNFLSKRVDVPFYMLSKLLKEKRITINGKKIKQDTVFEEGDVIKLWPKDMAFKTLEKKQNDSKDLGIEIIFENEDFLVLNKPAGVIVQGAQDNQTSLSLHLAFLKEKNNDNSDCEYIHVHRLDKDTSGVLVVGKTAPAVRELNHIFKSREIVKKYVAIVCGRPKKDEGKVELFLKRNPEGSRQKVGIGSEKDGKKTISLYRVLKTFTKNDEQLSLVEIDLKTGFMHQIRVHMKFLGCPILGDFMYGNSLVNQKFNLNRQLLHAKSIEFNGKKFEAELPKDMINFI